MDNGLFITFEGIDGCGKTSLLARLTKLWSAHCTVLQTKEPGGSALGKQLRTILQEQTIPLDPKAEFLLFAADRSQHFSTIVLPALEQGVLVLSDRCADSSIAYQGYGGGLPVTTITQINRWAMQNRQPDITVYLRITPEIAEQRFIKRNEKLTAFELRGAAYWNKVIHGFETLYTGKQNVVIIDGSATPDEVFEEALVGITSLVAHTQWHQRLAVQEIV